VKLLYFTRADSAHDRRFLNAFCEHGVQVGHLALQDMPVGSADQTTPIWVERLGSLGVKSAAPTLDLRAAAARLPRITAQFAPDLLMAGPLADCGFVAAQAKLPCPLVLQSWAFDVYWESIHEPGADQRIRAALHAGEALFADSYAVLKRCELIAGHRMPTSFIMPWGIEHRTAPPPSSRASLRRELGIAETRVVFLHNRHLEPVYSVYSVLTAFRDLHALDPNTTLLLASGGSLRPEVERFVSKNGLGECIRLLGPAPHDRALELLTAADFFVSHAASDGTSVSLLEAMAAGLPSIVSACGGNSEWVQPGVNGWIVPLGDTPRLTAAMASAVLLTPAEREMMGRAGQRQVRTRADWRVNFPSFVEFLRTRVRGSIRKDSGVR
jgi:glycosyltransferase involved in cell wall biosynthesis